MRQSLRKLYQLFTRREKVKAIILFFLMVVMALMEMIGIGAIPAFILVVASPDKVLTHPVTGPLVAWFGVETGRELLIVGSAGLIAFFIAKGLVVALISYVRIRFAQHKYIDLSGRLFRYYMLAPYAFHLNRNTSELLRNLMSETHMVVYNVFFPLMTIALNLVTMVFIVALLIIAEPFFSLVSMAGLGTITFLMMKFVEKKTDEHGREEMEHRKTSNKVVLEGLSGVKDARVLGRERSFIDRFDYSVWRRAKANFFKEMVQMSHRPVFETITVMGVLGLALALTARDESMESIIAVLALFAAATYRLMPTFRELLGGITTFRYHVFSVDPVYDDLQQLKNIIEKPASSSIKPMPFTSAIAVEGVSYSYPNSGEAVLSNINVVIPRGAAFALVGESGAGKTTLIDAMLGLLQITGGSIRVDGIDIFSDTRAWQQNIGYIPQFIYLTDDTLKRNVGFGLTDEDIDEEKFRQVIHAARLDELIGSLPDKENTIIGERGVRLSGGQRQRIGIARALYNNPQLLIMDEGTSALDNITEKYVIDAIEHLKGDRTIIMIAHRLTTVKNCDVICLMEKGRITDMGTYDELLKRNELFKQMADSQ